MRARAILLALCFAARLRAGQRLEVTLCNLGNFSASLAADAKKVVAYVFSTMNIAVVWVGCEPSDGGKREDWRPPFTIRLLADGGPKYPGGLSLAAMGRAYVGPSGAGYLADVYKPALKSLAERTRTEEGQLLGYTIVHELGHLLIGPGHRPGGIMSASWGDKETFKIGKNWLVFDPKDRVRIRERLAQMEGGSSLLRR
jgi:hypothetical protein